MLALFISKEAMKLPGKKFLPIGIIVILVIALGFTSTAAFAYWQDLARINNVVIRFEGEDASLVVEEMSPPFEGMLVPQGRVYFDGEVESVLFQYQVSIDRELLQTMNLLVEAIDVEIGGSSTYANLVDISIGSGGDSFEYELFNSVVTVNIVVRLLEPIDSDEAVQRGLDLSMVNVEDSELAYNTIKGEDISFVIRFSVTPRNND